MRSAVGCVAPDTEEYPPNLLRFLASRGMTTLSLRFPPAFSYGVLQPGEGDEEERGQEVAEQQVHPDQRQIEAAESESHE